MNLLIIFGLTIVVCFNNSAQAIDDGNYWRKFIGNHSSNYLAKIRKIHDKENVINSNEVVGKIEVLSRLLQAHIDDFRNETDQVEIVFLIDASSSVGPENFKSELNFVRRLLADLTVDESATRVAVVTFAGKGMIFRNIDHISASQSIGSKCTLLNEELGNIQWTGGGTYTRGALLEALAILQKSRPAARKVIILITDGFSNGGDPRPVAKLLKDLGAMILTFGIRTGNVLELHDIASEPGYTHSYLLDSFIEFEAIARRALYRDIQPGNYVLASSTSFCDALCDFDAAKDDSSCCDDLAECSCGTNSGHYACLCQDGYFGSGLKGACQPCPNGTYGNSCTRCPDANHVTLRVPATSPEDCTCAAGFITLNDSSCNAITCPHLEIPTNGYLVKANACSNVVNAACGIRCRIGYRLVGDSIRLCSKNGSWSGAETRCLLKTCPALSAPVHGHVHCEIDADYPSTEFVDFENTTALPIDTRCQFSCDPGYQLLGSKARNCLPVSRWDGLKASCKQIECDPLPKIANGFITPENCTGTGKLTFGTNCSIICMTGFDVQGPQHRICGGSSGFWSQRQIPSRCSDKILPEITCPADITQETIPGKRFALVNWTVPVGDGYSHIWSKPHLTLPWKAKIGAHTVTYFAQYVGGGRAKCRFKVHVLDREPPMVENCVDPPTFLTTNATGANNVIWDEPIFDDNSGKKLNITVSHEQGDFFPLGTTKVFYDVTDKSNNSVRCVMSITVQSTCQDEGLTNGARKCQELDNRDARCVITCDDGYVLPVVEDVRVEENVAFMCSTLENENWDHATSLFPDCTIGEIPEALDVGGRVFMELNDSINCQQSAHRLQEQVQRGMSLSVGEMCGNNSMDCRLLNADLECSPDDTAQRERRAVVDFKSRRKQKRNKLQVKFRFVAKIIAKYRHDPQQALSKLRQEIQSMTKSGQLDLFNEKTNREIGNLALNFRTIFEENVVREFCDPGGIFKKNKCVKCPSGTFHNSRINRNQCIPCHVGYYQDNAGSESCKRCPDATSTKWTRSRSLSNCVGICAPGYYSKKKYQKNQTAALEPCNSCDIGFYQPLLGQRQCLACPANTTTADRGSIDITRCITPREMCSPTSCANGGRCVEEPSGFSCECADNFVGSRCESFRDPCESFPCLNEGRCSPVRGPLSYSCACRRGFTGKNCEEYVDECLSQPCRNNGTCISNESEYRCSCRPGFAGEFCEILVDVCPNVCEEGSTCVSTNDSWRCLCRPGFLGRRCQLLPCDWLPCHRNAICIDIKENNTTYESYRCDCPAGYEGEDCSIRIDYCRDFPCENAGTCINNLTNYTCECLMNYDGPNCTEKLSPDFSLVFLKPGTTDYALLPGPRACLSEFTICLWLQSSDTFNYGTVFSYANTKFDNAITLTDYNGLVLYVNGLRVITDITLNDGFWHFLCITWNSPTGAWSIYVDGNLKQQGESLASGSKILANGSIVIGQEQDDIQGGLSASEAFVGRLSLLDMWDTILSTDLIKNLSRTCEEYSGTLISWAGIRKFLMGSVKTEKSDFCRACDAPIAPINGYVKVNDDFSVATYFCESGYNLKVGDRVLTALKRHCLKQGEWSGYEEQVKCSKVTCGYPEYFPRGRVHGKSYNFADEIYYTCESGYELRGNPHRVCNSAGRWSGRPPICLGVTCKSLLAPEHGDIEYIIEEHERDDLTILQVGQQLEFKCEPRFQLVGEAILTCMKSGLWNYDIPFCQATGCPLPMSIEHGFIRRKLQNEFLNVSIEEFYDYGDNITFFCDEGYKFVEESWNELQCTTNGSWVGLLSTCAPLKCPWPVIEHAKLQNFSVTGADLGFQLVLTCEDGYLASSNETTCETSGKWSEESLECVSLHCPPLSSHPIANLFVTRSVMKTNFTTEPSMGGLEYLTLAIEGDGFDDKLILRCNDEKKRLNLRNQKSNESLREISWRCSEKGVWEPREHLDLDDNELRSRLIESNVCESGKCQPPSIPMNALIVNSDSYDNWNVNDSLTFKCRDGFTLLGLDTVFCTSNGSWTMFFECKPNSCGEPPKIVNAQPEISGFNDVKSYVSGWILKYSCLPGFKVFGQSSIRCLSNGKWSRLMGKCLRISCGKPDVSDDVSLLGKSYLYQENLTFICPGNFSRGTMTCRSNGTWSILPDCQ